MSSSGKGYGLSQRVRMPSTPTRSIAASSPPSSSSSSYSPPPTSSSYSSSSGSSGIDDTIRKLNQNVDSKDEMIKELTKRLSSAPSTSYSSTKYTPTSDSEFNNYLQEQIISQGNHYRSELANTREHTLQMLTLLIGKGGIPNMIETISDVVNRR